MAERGCLLSSWTYIGPRGSNPLLSAENKFSKFSLEIMNTLEVKIQSGLVQAMKDKDSFRVSALKSIKQAIMESKTAKSGAIKDPTDSDIIKMIQKLTKQREESISIYKENNRADLADAEEKELAVLKEFLPKMLSESEIEDIVSKVISDLGASSMKDMGRVMGYINKSYAGQVDGSVVSKIVKSKLS